jgi:hypothetical protein
MSNQPVARVLDFSNIGRTPEQAMAAIQFPSVDNGLELPEQVINRARIEPNANEFAIGHGSFSGYAVGRQRRTVVDNETNLIHVSTTGRYFSIKKKYEPVFNPITIDEFYSKPCKPGHTRIPRQLINTSLGCIYEANILVQKPFHKLRKYFMYLSNSDTKFKSVEFAETFHLDSVSTALNYDYHCLWKKFAQFRYQMLRLMNAFLYRKSKKKMMLIPNYETMEDPSPTNCIEWSDVNSRCSYRIHGDTLLKSMKMYLYHSEYGFPDPLWPKNPTTNAPFTFGQIQHLVYELYMWCGKNKKPVPYILTRFQEAKFNLDTMIVKNRPELTLHSCRELFTEIHLSDAIEMWLDMVEEFAILHASMSRDELELELPRWVLSLDHEKDDKKRLEGRAFLAKWRNILPDLVQFSRFKYFNRADWQDVDSLKKMVKTLWANTYHYVKKFSKERKEALRRAGRPVRLNSDGEETDSSVDTVEAPVAPHPAPVAPHPAPVIQHHINTNALLAYFTNQINSPVVNHHFEISAEWNNVLEDSAEGAVDLEYNMIMFNSLILPLPPIPPQLPPAGPQPPALAEPAEPSPVNLLDSFESVD